jgi:hypothetical protein
MNVKITENSELILRETKNGEFSVQLTESELGEFRIVMKMFDDWQKKLKDRCEDKDGRPGFTRQTGFWRE